MDTIRIKVENYSQELNKDIYFQNVKNLNSISIAQVTDIHIGPEDILYHNINVRDNFLRVLKDVIEKGPFDYLVLSGDLAIDFGEIEAYYWIKEVLKEYPIPVIIMAGNHDSVERLDRVFNLSDDLKNGMLYFKREIKGFPIYFLDSEPDYVHQDQLEWLKKSTKSLENEALLFIHHPPLMMDCEFMDRKYPLRNAAEVFKAIRETQKIRHVFTGHYHSEGHKSSEEINIYTAPATQMQIDKKNHDFEMSDTRPGWRAIYWNGQTLKTEVNYLKN